MKIKVRECDKNDLVTLVIGSVLTPGLATFADLLNSDDNKSVISPLFFLAKSSVNIT